MSDFEVCPAGTLKEIELSRELVKAIEQLKHQYGEGIIPPSVSLHYDKLKSYYDSHN